MFKKKLVALSAIMIVGLMTFQANVSADAVEEKPYLSLGADLSASQKSKVLELLGVNISSGKHKVSLKYTPPGFTVGWKITVLSAAIFLILCKIIHSRKLRQLHGK